MPTPTKPITHNSSSVQSALGIRSRLSEEIKKLEQADGMNITTRRVSIRDEGVTDYLVSLNYYEEASAAVDFEIR